MSTNRAIREQSIECIISIDTRKSRVARAAIAAGANIINDVSGGDFDPLMYDLIKELQVPYIVMHMRGTPETMTSPSHLEYSDLIEDIQSELQIKLDTLDRFLPRWYQIIDPGVGFAKSLALNKELLTPANLKRLKALLNNRSMLVGVSRKRFLSSILSPSSSFSVLSVEDRDLATAGACAATLQGGVEMLRVHNVRFTRIVCDIFCNISHISSSQSDI